MILCGTVPHLGHYETVVRLGERIVMKTAILAALALFFGATWALAVPLRPGMANQEISNVVPDEFLGVMQVVDKKRKRKRGSNYGRSFIPGYVLTPYGRRDCRGWWHQHSDETLHCHGVLVRPDWR